MPIIVAVNFGMAIEANWNRIIARVGSAIRCWNDVVHLHLDAAESVTDATTPMTSNQQVFDFFRSGTFPIRPPRCPANGFTLNRERRVSQPATSDRLQRAARRLQRGVWRL